jgi:two-component system, OmpR family, sensor kinase
VKLPNRLGRLTWVWLPVVGLILVGLVLEAWFESGVPTFAVRVQAGLGALLLMLGVLLGGLGLGGWAVAWTWRRATRLAVVRERDTQASVHRRFIRRLDHELKNPLTAITLALANLAEAAPDGSAGSLHNIGRQVDRLSGLANDLRKLADLEARDIERARVDLAEVVEEAVALARAGPRAEQREVVASVQRVPWAPPPVLGDRDLLVLALYNLLDNALKFSRPGGTVEIRARDDGQIAVIEVADTGSGIRDDDLPHVTEELYRGQTSHAVEGSGLGLALVDRVARVHGGTLVIASRPDQGTVVALRIPGLQTRGAAR